MANRLPITDAKTCRSMWPSGKKLLRSSGNSVRPSMPWSGALTRPLMDTALSEISCRHASAMQSDRAKNTAPVSSCPRIHGTMSKSIRSPLFAARPGLRQLDSRATSGTTTLLGDPVRTIDPSPADWGAWQDARAVAWMTRQRCSVSIALSPVDMTDGVACN